MAWLPMMKIPHQSLDANGDFYLNAVLKTYQAGTTTNISMATDYTGATTVGSVAINAAGYPTVSGNVIVPHIDQTYKIVLYPTQADADADNFGGAIFTVDNINPGTTSADIFYAETTGSSNAYVASISGLLSLTTGTGFMIKLNHTNTASSTITINGLSAVTFKKNGTENVSAGDLIANAFIFCVYDGTDMQVIGGLPALGTVKVSSNDTTANYLLSKLAAGTAITLTETDDGSDETIEVAVDLSAINLTNYQAVTSSGTWTKPTYGTFAFVQQWGGGGGGGVNIAGGGGGAYNEKLFLLSSLGSSESVTIGAGGIGHNAGVTSTGTAGGTTSFGTHLYSYGGGGGGNIGGGGGGGVESVGGSNSADGGAPGPGTKESIDSITGGGGPGANTYSAVGGRSVFGGGGGGYGGVGGASVYGGGGGGYTSGHSIKGGNGGGNYANGTVPGGGGGAGDGGTDGGDGARGECRVWVW